MTFDVVSVACGGPGFVSNIEGLPCRVIDNRANLLSPCQAYQQALESSNSEDVLIYGHDDVTINDPNWLQRVLQLFDNPNCVVAGLGGAQGLGHKDIFKKSYDIWQMARWGYVSNQTDWKTHGGHETGARRVAVVDAFFLAVHTAWLKQIGGWPVQHIGHHCIDLFICLEAARRGKEVWMVGCQVDHWGGGSSTKPVYEQAKWLQGGTLASDHQTPHRWLYDSYRDCLPLEVK